MTGKTGFARVTFRLIAGAGLLHGLKLVAVAIVVLYSSSSLGQIGAIVLGAFLGLWLCRSAVNRGTDGRLNVPISPRIAIAAAVLFFVLLLGLPLLRSLVMSHNIALFDAFYRLGALVFGGGHVVLPLLREAFVASGWVTDDAFLAGYGAAQAVPGPLFTFAAYLGAAALGGVALATSG